MNYSWLRRKSINIRMKKMCTEAVFAMAIVMYGYAATAVRLRGGGCKLVIRNSMAGIQLRGARRGGRRTLVRQQPI